MLGPLLFPKSSHSFHINNNNVKLDLNIHLDMKLHHFGATAWILKRPDGYDVNKLIKGKEQYLDCHG